jgi:two-component SAPR family response regulator
MRAVLIDDERPALDELSYLLKENSIEVIGTFQNTNGVLDFILQEKSDVVFLDIELREKNGIDFGVELQNSIESTAIIFVTAYPEYALEAFRAYPLDYITKPVDEERLARTLRHVRSPPITRV